MRPGALARALSLLVIVCAQSGCHFTLPISQGQWATHNKFEQTIGPADARTPIRVGASTRADVREVLGKPWNAYRDEQAATLPVYRYADSVPNGVWIWTWPFVHGGPIQKTYSEHELAFWFAPDGRVSKYDMWKDQYRGKLEGEPPPMVWDFKTNAPRPATPEELGIRRKPTTSTLSTTSAR
jgi:hypothetical protein